MALEDTRFRKSIVMAILLGVCVGLFSALFTLAWHGLESLFWGHLEIRLVDRIWFSTAAGLIIGLVLTWLHDPGSMATIIYHFHKSGKLPMRDNLPIQPVSLLGLVAGQSAGPEGALTQAGGSLGAWVSRLFHQPQYMRLLTLAGMGAGFGAFLGAPVGGAVLWLEMLHTRGLEYFEAIIPTMVCSSAAYLVMVVTLGHGVVQPWHITDAAAATWWMPLIAVGIGLACGPFAKLYALIFRRIGRLVNLVRCPIIVRTTLAGLIIGLLGYICPLSYFYGGKQMGDLFALQATAWVLLGLILAKVLAVCVTVRGHWQGGLIIPHMFIGATFGKLLVVWFPGLDPVLAMLCGMAGFNAAATQTPLSSALIVLALTGYGNPAPVFLAGIAGFLAGQGTVIIENKQSRTAPLNFHHEPVESQIVP
jgi:H+/Cl- antiporter ClcA